MGKRTDLQDILEATLGSDNVYFQPPETVKMKYPCIVYARSSGRTIFADDIPYRHKKRYTLTLIDKNPDTDILDKLINLPMCTYDRNYKAENLNHDVCNIYF